MNVIKNVEQEFKMKLLKLIKDIKGQSLNNEKLEGAIYDAF